MSKIEKSIDVNVPVREAYDQWTRYESFPQFMDGVEFIEARGSATGGWRGEVVQDAVTGGREPATSRSGADRNG
jgi:uncharacterized membrane protein